MTIVSSKEFATNQQKYFDLAIDNKEVYIKNGKNMFMVCYANRQKEPAMIFEPDDDFYRSLSANEFRKKLVEVVEKIDKKYTQKCK